MSNKMICPVCGKTELIRMFNPLTGEYFEDYDCPFRLCNFRGNKVAVDALIQAKQDLKIVRQALEEIDTTRCIPQQTLISLGKFSKTTRFNAGNIICVATPDQIHNTLEQINRKQD